MFKQFTAACLFAAAGAALAQTGQGAAPNNLTRVEVQGTKASLVSVEDFVRQPALTQPIMSRSGRYFASTAPSRGRMNLVVMDLQTRQGSLLSSLSDFDVIGINWVGEDHLVFSLGQQNSPTGPGQFDGGGLFAVSRDGKYQRRISPTIREVRAQNQFVYRGLSYFRSIPGSDTEFLATGNLTSAESTDVYRVDVRTGRSTLITQGRPPGIATRWVLDSKLVPRVVEMVRRDELITTVHYRKDADSPWQEIARYDPTKGPVFKPLAFESDDKILQVAYNGERQNMAVFRYDPEAKKMIEVAAQHPRFDMGADAQGQIVPGVITEPGTGKIIGYAVAADKPQTVWIDETYQRFQRMIDGALPNTVNTFRRTPDGKQFLVTAVSDRSSPRWYLMHEEKKTLEEIGAGRPWLNADKLAEVRPFLLKTRDGLEIPSYYILPRDYVPGTKVPTVLHIHGGPFARADLWGQFSFGIMEGQILASRGYAVVIPNFRVTPGLGNDIYYKGFGAYGRQMSEDHEDAARWAIAQGFADPKRMCISGASYGGYAVMRALQKSPDLFKCGVAGLMVVDMKRQLTSRFGDTAGNDAGVEYWRRVLGVPNLDDPIVRQISPNFWADQIKQPVFIYAGRDDIRTPLEQTRLMIDALTRAGNPPKDVMIADNEGHGFGRVENNKELYERMLKFLAEHLEK
ncbi:alpha/beta hydrolase family protein [Piscinibacterium candidicorallinum]|uniref:Alpha/beta hydrolase family protein n=1 Tax=Piscinibacterium candidicorallinum TaxID=1793872 RepID=A0ABV7H5Z9_9BURK